ncbi:MAG: SPASM domain-containing protein [Candidatus Brocadiaceae bacterium]|nr:SPASM domain-containing protein [Candidatus Brocadiaceae bacterium]
MGKRIYLLVEKRQTHKKIQAFTKNEPTMFDTIGIETSEKCNRKCGFCPNSVYAQGQEEMPKALFERILIQLEKLKFNGTVVLYQYNEPLLDPRLEGFIAQTRGAIPNATIMFSSNGDYLNYERWINLRKSGLDFSVISQYDGKINNNIAEILKKLDEKEPLMVSIRSEKDLKSTRAGTINFSEIPLTPINEPCLRPFSQLVIRYTGKVIICCEDYLNQVIIGDTKIQTIESIWNSDQINKIRYELLQGKRRGICTKCNTTFKQSVDGCEWIATPRRHIYEKGKQSGGGL